MILPCRCQFPCQIHPMREHSLLPRVADEGSGKTFQLFLRGLQILYCSWQTRLWKYHILPIRSTLPNKSAPINKWIPDFLSLYITGATSESSFNQRPDKIAMQAASSHILAPSTSDSDNTVSKSKEMGQGIEIVVCKMSAILFRPQCVDSPGDWASCGCNPSQLSLHGAMCTWFTNWVWWEISMEELQECLIDILLPEERIVREEVIQFLGWKRHMLKFKEKNWSN